MAGCLAFASLAAQGQQTAGNDTAAQRVAMEKLSFLSGHWSGPASVRRGPGEALRVTQSEEVQYKLGGLVLLIEGTSRDADGKIVFGALATVSYDAATHSYRFRAYNDGHYLDTELTVMEKGFTWSYPAGPVVVKNTMHVSEKGEWVETTDAVMGDQPARRSVEMTLSRKE